MSVLVSQFVPLSPSLAYIHMLLLFSHSGVSDYDNRLLQHTRLPCPSPSPGVCSNSCPLSQWCHPIISSSAIPISSFLQSFPALGSFPMSWLFTSGGHSIESSASVSVLPMSSQGRFPLGLTGLISWKSRDFQESSPAPQFKSINCLVLSLFYGSTLTSVHDYWENYSFDYMDFHRQSDVSVF